MKKQSWIRVRPRCHHGRQTLGLTCMHSGTMCSSCVPNNSTPNPVNTKNSISNVLILESLEFQFLSACNLNISTCYEVTLPTVQLKYKRCCNKINWKSLYLLGIILCLCLHCLFKSTSIMSITCSGFDIKIDQLISMNSHANGEHKHHNGTISYCYWGPLLVKKRNMLITYTLWKITETLHPCIQWTAIVWFVDVWYKLHLVTQCLIIKKHNIETILYNKTITNSSFMRFCIWIVGCSRVG